MIDEVPILMVIVYLAHSAVAVMDVSLQTNSFYKHPDYAHTCTAHAIDVLVRLVLKKLTGQSKYIIGYRTVALCNQILESLTSLPHLLILSVFEGGGIIRKSRHKHIDQF